MAVADAVNRGVAAVPTRLGLPGVTGTPCAATWRFERILSPMTFSAPSLGPRRRCRPSHGAGEVDVLRQEAVAGVHGLGADVAAGLDDGLDIR